MEIQSDFKELLELFNKNKVDYMIVGGYALAFHGAPRYTGDIDIFVHPDPENSRRILEALSAFGFGSLGLTTSDFENKEKVVQLGIPPVRVDILTSLTGISWETALANRTEGKYGNISVYYIGREQFIVNKKTIARKKDLADLEALGEE